MNIFKKLFCGHKYKTHSKKEYEWIENRMVKGTEWWYAPKFEIVEFSETTEIFICEHCGKIKKIEY